jgi:hypothetical protein
MEYVFSPEVYDPERGLYRFRCYLTAYVERWTFWIAEATLRELPPACRALEGDSLFCCLKQVIHQAALVRMSVGDPDVEHVLTLHDFKQMSTLADEGAQAPEVSQQGKVEEVAGARNSGRI